MSLALAPFTDQGISFSHATQDAFLDRIQLQG